ncbi:MAG: Fic family protein [Rickettsiaceae bacterium]|jgi:Fic family protein|nr:Fic family protein [Rickettsiaceae bacterium]
MKWNWQHQDWPKFRFKKDDTLDKLELEFIYKAGLNYGAYNHINSHDKENLTIELISEEALKTSEIEGEILNRDSLQSSIRRNFGLATDHRKVPPAEQGIAEMMVNLYRTFASPLSHEMMFKWHTMLTSGRRDLINVGAYRTHQDPMQVVSGAFDKPKIHFEAPASKNVVREMESYVKWFNSTSPKGQNLLPALTRAATAHLYFVCIHPFEDGNGRIGRALAEKVLSQSLGKPALIALSYQIQKYKKQYYEMLENSNKNNEITAWVLYFGKTIVQAQEYTQKKIDFLIGKAKLYDKIRGQLNPRQEKALTRMFAEGIEGFQGGLSAENYILITNTSRATATRDLQELVSMQALKKCGELKHTRYYLDLSV